MGSVSHQSCHKAGVAGEVVFAASGENPHQLNAVVTNLQLSHPPDESVVTVTREGGRCISTHIPSR